MMKKVSSYEAFMSGTRGSLDITVSGVPVAIYAEEIGVKYYFKIPYDQKYDYNVAAEFMRYAIPALSRELEDRRNKRLMGPDCIKGKHLS